jgi:prephenate dehydrogenase
MKTIAIAGVGLIGGSFALAVRRAGFAGRILGVSSPATLDEALRLGIIDDGVSLEQACAVADLLYLAQPIQRIIGDCARIAPHLHAQTLVTDAGSTKCRIVKAAKVFTQGTFLGGHPMAGKESRGVAAAEATLFEGRPYLLTPESLPVMEIPAVREFVEMIGAIGANVIVLTPEEHDRLAAFTSHLPQMISTALGMQLAQLDRALDVAGPAVIDMTRLALSPYEMWRDIIATNLTHVSAAIDSFISNLRHLQANLASEQAEGLFAKAGRAARDIRKKH